ncbi:MAG: hypothetical protein U0T79_05205 [Ferruginibacter sp.]
MKLILLLISFSLQTVLYGQVISLKDYFPLKAGEKKVYRIYKITKADTTLMQDSIVTICESKIIDKEKVFYFRRDVFPDDTVLCAVLPGLYYAFYYKDGNLMTFPALFKSKLDKVKLKDFKLDYPNQIRLNKVYADWTKSTENTYKFEGYETVKIKDSIFTDCIKMTTGTYYLKFLYSKTLWFKKGVGLVKFLEEGEIGSLWEIRL